ncbi:uncharacterized protein TRIADDRAFT_55431 [Trichoplax adhaerens]|uniref:Endonuclease/exonuclease/phosphatase domain-containing protein n=1 Tax=Trichoplax adhaerens TaxID=10228 RepID=B3RUV8_TRIAD|nr:predicted protein [Trichoplax adhaerens]EDV25387.1 predicted protein [Trichoplax adhaerens]|eukprot:XP_002111420.1 predicted protein [Trichoplax adhaerens]
MSPSITWDVEGIAFISRHYLIHSASTNLTLYDPNDSSSYSSSAVATVKMYILGLGNIDVSAVMLSGNSALRCKEIGELFHYLGTHVRSSYRILMGDFNVNRQQESIMNDMLNGQFKQNSTCFLTSPYRQQRFMKWKDAWIEADPGYAGITYSPVPTIGYIARRDRILLSNSLRIRRALLEGYGARYKSLFVVLVIWERFKAVMSMGYSHFRDSRGDDWFYYGSTCSYKCGNGKSCRCGVCSNSRNSFCYLDQCTECTMVRFVQLTLILICFCISSLFSCILLLRLSINIWLNENYNLTPCSWMTNGWWGRVRAIRRGFTLSKLHSTVYRIILCLIRKLINVRKLQIPSLIFRLILAFYLIIISIIAARWGIYDTIHLIKTVVPEEQYPADHLCLIATVEAVK